MGAFANITPGWRPGRPNSFLDAPGLQQVGRAEGCLQSMFFASETKDYSAPMAISM
jgi:hypothetical protein